VLPVLETEFGTDAPNWRPCRFRGYLWLLPWRTCHLARLLTASIKRLFDRGSVIASAQSDLRSDASLALLIGARFIQGLFIPSHTTCIAAYLARSLPPLCLNVVMGSYVAATVAGGLGGRLLVVGFIRRCIGATHLSALPSW